MSQKELLVKIMQIVINSGVCPETNEKEWAKLILYAHTRGFLYTTPDFKTVVCAYRSKSDTHEPEMPFVEEGEHLHVVWAASESSDKNSLLKLMRAYLKSNKVKDITYRRTHAPETYTKLKGNYNG